MAAVTWVLSGRSDAAAPPDWYVLERGNYVEYQTAARYYCHIDLGNDKRRYIFGLISGANEVDGLVLVVSLSDGPSIEKE